LYWLIIISCIALLFFFFIKSQSDNNNELKKISSGITELINLNYQLSDALIHNNSGLVNHYDKLVSSSNRLEEKSQQFFHTTSVQKYPQLNFLWQDYLQALKRRQEAIEQYKSHSAILKNSQAYFVYVSHQLEKYLKLNQLEDQLADIFHFISNNNKVVTFNHTNDQQIINKISQIAEELRSKKLEKVSYLFDDLLVHSQIIREIQLEVAGLLTMSYRSETKELLDQIFQNYLLIQVVSGHFY